MPEEINRVLTDHLADYLFATEASALENLRREGIAGERVHLVGNVMIDTLLSHRERARALAAPARHGVRRGEYALLTLHRPSNVDEPEGFERLMRAISANCRRRAGALPRPPENPRARSHGPRRRRRMVSASRLRLLDPLGYHEFIGLMDDSAAVLTDSGGAQEESTALGVPCLTLRENTERPVTVTNGTNRIVGSDPERIVAAWRAHQRGQPPSQPAAVVGRRRRTADRGRVRRRAQLKADARGFRYPISTWQGNRSGLACWWTRCELPAWVRQIITEIEACSTMPASCSSSRRRRRRSARAAGAASLGQPVASRLSRLSLGRRARVPRLTPDAFAKGDAGPLLQHAAIMPVRVRETRFCDYVSDEDVARIRGRPARRAAAIRLPHSQGADSRRRRSSASGPITTATIR